MVRRRATAEAPAARHFRDRIVRLDRVKSSELVQNQKNWRTHPEEQQAAMQGVLSEIGWTDALIARERPDGRLELIDGHLRASIDPDEIVPVLVVDVTEEESDKLLTILDPLTAMAEMDPEKLNQLLASVTFDSESMNSLLESLQAECAELSLVEIAEGPPEESSTGGTDEGEEEAEASSFVNLSFPVTASQEIELRRLIKIAKQSWSIESSGQAIVMALTEWESLRGTGSGENP